MNRGPLYSTMRPLHPKGHNTRDVQVPVSPCNSCNCTETRRRRRQNVPWHGAVTTHLPVCSTINDVVSKQPRSTDGGSAALVPVGRRGPARSHVADDAEYTRADATVGRRGGTVGGRPSSSLYGSTGGGGGIDGIGRVAKHTRTSQITMSYHLSL